MVTARTLLRVLEDPVLIEPLRKPLVLTPRKAAHLLAEGIHPFGRAPFMRTYDLALLLPNSVLNEVN